MRDAASVTIGKETAPGGIAADISATGSGAKKSVAGGITAEHNSATAAETIEVTVYGDVAGKITANSTTTNYDTATTNKAFAYGIAAIDTDTTNHKSGLISVTGSITKDISATATAKTVTVSGVKQSQKAEACGMYATNALAVAGTVAKITANAKSEQDGADAYGICSQLSTVTLGGITGDISATASGTSGEANAYGLYSNGGSISVTGRITKAITAKATSKSDYGKAYGILTNGANTVTLDQGLNADVTATASGTSATAYAVEGTGGTGVAGIIINGDVAGKLNATATQAATETAGYIKACGLFSSAGSISVTGRITKAITAKASGKNGVVTVQGISANSTAVIGGIAADISSTGDGLIAIARGIEAVGITVNGDVAGKITATATATGADYYASAYGLESNAGSISVTGRITKAVTVKATNKSSTAEAYGLKGRTITLGKETAPGGIAADVSATASGATKAIAGGMMVEATSGNTTTITVYGNIAGKITANATTTGYYVDETEPENYKAFAYGLSATNLNTTAPTSGLISVTGSITKDISATATAKTGTDTTGTKGSQAAEAYGMYASKTIAVDGTVGKITAKATSGQNTAEAYGINAVYGTVTLGGISGDISATASGTQGKAYAVNVKTSITVNGDVAGKLNATATGTTKITSAYGLSSYASTASSITVTGRIMKAVTVKATSQTNSANAYGINSAYGTVTLGGIAADISATANGSAEAKAYGIHGKSDTGAGTLTDPTVYAVGIGGDVEGKITATATAAAGTATAFGFHAESSLANSGTLSIAGKITKAVTVKATSKSSTANAYGLNAYTAVTLGGTTADNSATASGAAKSVAGGIMAEGYGGTAEGAEDKIKITVNGDIAGKITANSTTTNYDTATTNKAFAYGIAAIDTDTTNHKSGKIAVTGSVTKDISATATAKTVTVYDKTLKKNVKYSQAAEAYGMYATKNISVGGTIGKITAKATSEQNASSAYGIRSCIDDSSYLCTVKLGGTAGDISATANGTTAEACGIYGQYDSTTTPVVNAVEITGNITGKINATATATGSGNDDTADAWGIWADSGTARIGGKITKAVSASATGKNCTANAGGLKAAYVEAGGIAADITANANGKTANAYGVWSTTKTTVSGDITGKINATATATTSAAYAYGLYNSSADNLALQGAVTGTITVKATSKGNSAKAYGIYTGQTPDYSEYGTLSVAKELGTVNVTASGSGSSSDEAVGWRANNIVTTSGEITGKATVTCKNGEAYGLKGTMNNAVATLDITATGKSAYGIHFTRGSTVTLKDSKITAKGSDSSDSLQGSAWSETITLDNSTLTGKVELYAEADTLILTNKSKIIGDVDLGDGTYTDTLRIHSGSQIKGEISNVENTWLVLDDSSSAKTALWEGTSASSFGNINLDLNSTLGESAKGFNLLKRTDTAWTSATVNVYFDGDEATKKLTLSLSDTVAKSCAGSAYEYQLLTKDNDKTLYLAVTEKTA